MGRIGVVPLWMWNAERDTSGEMWATWGSGMCGENWMNVRDLAAWCHAPSWGKIGAYGWVSVRPGSLVPRSVMGENRGIWVGE